MADHPLGYADPRRDTDRLDVAPLRYVLLQRSRMNMLELNRQLERLRGSDDQLWLEPGAVRSERRYRIAVTFQLAVEMQLADDRAVQWVDGDAQRRELLIDAVYYPSHLWQNGEGPHIDDKALAEYLTARLRLEEGDAPLHGTSSPVRPSALSRLRETYGADKVDRQVLTDDTLKLLRAMVDAVMTSLYATCSREQWQQRSRACAQHAGFRMPPPEVLDNLLVGRDSLVQTEHGPWRWRYAAIDPASEGADPAAAPMSAVADLESAIAATEDMLWPLLQTDAEAGEPPWRAYALLADHYRVLPTSPAVAEVTRARLALRSRSERSTALDSHQRVLHDFNEMRRQTLPGLLDVLLHAAYVGGADLRNGLSLLSRGLGFARLDLAGIQAGLQRLRDAQSDFEPAWGAPLHAIVASDVPQVATREALARQLQIAREARTEADWTLGAARQGELVAAAWNEALARLSDFCRDGQARPLGALELHCHATGTGPGQWLDVVAEDTTLRGWTGLLLQTLDDSALPARLAGVALARLGAGNSSPVQRDALLAVLTRILGTRPDVPQFSEAVAWRGLWSSGQRSFGTMLVVCKEHSSMVERWRRPPRRCVALVATAPQLLILVLRHPDLLAALPRPVRVEWEEPVDAGVEREMLQRRLLRATGEATAPIGLLRRLAALFQRSVPVPPDRNPSGPDELLAAAIATD